MSELKLFSNERYLLSLSEIYQKKTRKKRPLGNFTLCKKEIDMKNWKVKTMEVPLCFFPDIHKERKIWKAVTCILINFC